MEWKSKEQSPTEGQHIVIVFENELTNVNIITCYFKKSYDNVWVLSRNEKLEIIAQKKIRSWILVDLLLTDAFFKTREDPVEITCPHCRKQSIVQAEAVEMDWIYVLVFKDLKDNCIYLDWDSVDAQCGFHYICSECQEEIAKDISSLEDFLQTISYDCKISICK